VDESAPEGGYLYCIGMGHNNFRLPNRHRARIVPRITYERNGP
jgi:hypothetical protein